MASQAYTSGQIARMLDIPARTIRAYLASGRLRAEQNPITGRWRISREALLSFMRDNGMDPERLGRPLRVMVVDRDHETAGLVRTALNGHGKMAVVHHLPDCASALIAMGDSPPDLLVLDAATAGDRCSELIAAIRDNERTRRTRLLLLQPQAQVSGAAWPREVDAVSKPIDPGRLHDALLRTLARVPPA